MERLKVSLISGRTANQGIGLEEGKLSKRYAESVNYVQLNPDDAEKMSLQKSDHVKVTTDYGSVTVNWSPDKSLDSCMVFFPYGPWANQVYSSCTSGTGMPIMKGIPALIEVSDESPMSLEEIVEKLKRGV